MGPKVATIWRLDDLNFDSFLHHYNEDDDMS